MQRVYKEFYAMHHADNYEFPLEYVKNSLRLTNLKSSFVKIMDANIPRTKKL